MIQPGPLAGLFFAGHCFATQDVVLQSVIRCNIVW